MEPATPNFHILDLRQSSVVPGKITDEGNDKELTDLDLALKLHYIKGVYFFCAEAARDLTIENIKVAMNLTLTRYNLAAGRIRRREETGRRGRPFIKCNDSGVRVLEAYCDMAMEESLGFEDIEVEDELRVSLGGRMVECLVHDGVLGPDLGFSPLVYLQITKFKCGGLAIGLNWAHVLGDPVSASAFLNTWARVLHGQNLPESLHAPTPWSDPLPSPRKPTFLKRVEPRGDHWLPNCNPKMESHSFHLTPKQLSTVFSVSTKKEQSQKGTSYFHVLSALVWKSISKVRGYSGPKAVTLCSIITNHRDLEVPCNKLTFSTVRTETPVEEMGLLELAIQIGENQQEEENFSMLDDDGDYLAYGTRLTFVNMEGADVYGLVLKGHRPVFVDYHIRGVGGEGTVVLLPAGAGGGGRTLAVTLPADQLAELKLELDRELALA